VADADVVGAVSKLVNDCDRLATEIAELPQKTVIGHTLDDVKGMQVTSPASMAGFVGNDIMAIASEARRHLGDGVFIVIAGWSDRMTG
jgi:hypothetical protein